MDPNEIDTFDMMAEERLWPTLIDDGEATDYYADRRPDPDDQDDDEANSGWGPHGPISTQEDGYGTGKSQGGGHD